MYMQLPEYFTRVCTGQVLAQEKESYSFFKFPVKGLDLRIPSTQEAAYKTYNLRSQTLHHNPVTREWHDHRP